MPMDKKRGFLKMVKNHPLNYGIDLQGLQGVGTAIVVNVQEYHASIYIPFLFTGASKHDQMLMAKGAKTIPWYKGLYHGIVL